LWFEVRQELQSDLLDQQLSSIKRRTPAFSETRGVRIYEWRKRYIPLNRQNRLRIPATKVIAKQQDSYVQNRVYDKIAESMSDISLIRCYEKVRRGWISSA
jgi:hypothetical protein